MSYAGLSNYMKSMLEILLKSVSVNSPFGQISGSHGDEYEDGCLLESYIVYSGRY
jgi:hypothetical protein